MPIPPYPTDELESRISDGSIDQSRLAASVLELQTTVASMVTWINQQIQPAAPESASSTKGKGASSGSGNAKG